VHSLELFLAQHQSDLPGELQRWLNSGRSSVLERSWIVVPSAAMRQRLDWDLAGCGKSEEGIASNLRFLFLDEFVAVVEELVLRAIGNERIDWRVESIAGRLASLAGGGVAWSDVLAEATMLDEVIRWRPETIEVRSFPLLTTRLLATEEWQHHGPLIQRAMVIDGLIRGMGSIPKNIALFGLANAPGANSFVDFVKALSIHSRVAVFMLTGNNTNGSPVSWSRAADQQLTLWAGIPVREIVPMHTTTGDTAALQAALTGGGASEFTNDSSVKLLGAVGLARQVEMARDQVILLLEQGKASPHEILVTAPNIDTVTPHIERLWGFEKFSNDGQRLPRLPFEFVERSSTSFRSRDRLALQLLRLVGGYLSAEEVEETLAYPAMKESLGITEEVRGRLLTLAREGRLVFGASSAQRDDLNIFPAGSESGTWDRILARLSMTAMMPDNAEDPDQLGTGDDVFALARVRLLFDAVEFAQSDLKSVQLKTMGEWRQWLVAIFGQFFERGRSKDSSLERSFERMRADFPSDDAIRVSFEFFRSYWGVLTESGAKAQTFGRYGVHVAPLPALAYGSYRYVIVLGLDEEQLPNAQLRSPTLTPPRIGDPNPRAALVASLYTVLRGARDGVILCFNERNELSGEEVKRSVVLEEIVERIGGDDSPLIVHGARHGFAIPTDREIAGETFDPRYEGLATLIVNASVDIKALSEGAAVQRATLGSLEEVSVKQLHRFVRDSAAHFIERGLHGSAMGQIDASTLQPRVDVDGLINYNLRLEIIENIAQIKKTLKFPNAEKGYLEILSRESVASELPLLLNELRRDPFLGKAATDFRSDLECFESLSSEEAKNFYRPLVGFSGVTLRIRSNSPDESNPWTAYHDFSSRQSDQPGAFCTFRLYPNGLAEKRDWRDTLVMLVDLLILKVLQPPDDSRRPTATEFFAQAGAKSTNAQISYRFRGSVDEARQLLGRLIMLYKRGLEEPVAIGRNTTPMLIEGGPATDGFTADKKEPLFASLFGTSLREFRSHRSFGEATNLFKDIADLVEKCRETGSKREAGTRCSEDAQPTYLPMLNYVENVKDLENAKKVRKADEKAMKGAMQKKASADEANPGIVEGDYE
jgi:Exodeoxyribonuclease V, gamma subunit